MKKSRKLAWVVLGVAVVGTVVFLAWLSTLYSPWEPVAEPQDQYPSWIFGQRPVVTKVRHQKFPWLPGKNSVYVRIEQAEHPVTWSRFRPVHRKKK